MPGCVTAHEKSGDNKNVVDDDPKGAKVFCDGQTPSFNPIQYEPENLTIEQSAPVPTVPGPPETPAPAAPDIPKKPVTAVVEEQPAPEFLKLIGLRHIYHHQRQQQLLLPLL